MKKLIALAILFTFALPVFADTDFTPPTPDTSPVVEPKPTVETPHEDFTSVSDPNPNQPTDTPSSGGGDEIVNPIVNSWSGGINQNFKIQLQINAIRKLLEEISAQWYAMQG